MRIFNGFICIMLMIATGSFAMAGNDITGEWVYRITFSTLDGGGDNREMFRFNADSSFEYRLQSNYFSAKQGSKKIDMEYRGSFRVEGKTIVFFNVEKRAGTREDMVPRWAIIEYGQERIQLKPETSPERGGYMRTFTREGR